MQHHIEEGLENIHGGMSLGSGAQFQRFTVRLEAPRTSSTS